MTFTPCAFKRNLLCLSAIMACAGAAQAQSTVTLYGILDAGLRYSTGLNAANAGSSTNATSVGSGINSTSRFGMRGTEDLGGGLKAIFNLEGGVGVDTGASASATKLFDRAAVVGLRGNWGTLTAGRQTTVIADVIGAVDPLGARYTSFNPNVAIGALSAHRLGQEYGPAGSTTGAYRLDNSLKYVGQVGAFSVRAMHAAGESGSNSNRSFNGLGGNYQAGNYSAALSYGQFKTAAGLTLKGYLGGVSAMLGKNRLSVTYGSHNAETTATATTRNRTFGIGGLVPITPQIDLVGAYYKVARTRTAAPDDGFSRVIAFAEYKFSKRTRAYLELDHTRFKTGYETAGTKQNATGTSVGVSHSF
ncbi:MAG: porin, Gram-negative type [Polaromonas sp.]|nr:porin, Gram-negative type [Polaromonas sp.]